MHVFHVNYREHSDVYIFSFSSSLCGSLYSWARESAVCMKFYTRSAAASALFRCIYILVEHKFCLKCVHSCNFNSASLFALGFFSPEQIRAVTESGQFMRFFWKTVEWPNAVSNVCQEWKIFGRLFVLCRQAPVRWVVSKVKSWEQLKFCLAHHHSAEKRERMNEKFDCEKWTQRVTTRV